MAPSQTHYGLNSVDRVLEGILLAYGGMLSLDTNSEPRGYRWPKEAYRQDKFSHKCLIE